MGLKNVTQNQRSMASSIQCECDADCDFWLWGHNTSWTSTLWPDSEQGILSKVMKTLQEAVRRKKTDLDVCVCVCVCVWVGGTVAP
jgi:hypothetical protein